MPNAAPAAREAVRFPADTMAERATSTVMFAGLMGH
jgi:hypothetical protein